MPTQPKGLAGEGFPKSKRLLERHHFLRARSRGRKIHTAHLIALALPNRGEERRLGITVSTKVGNSVERNRVKRWLRDIFRKDFALLPARTDLVLIAKSGAPQQGRAALRAQFVEIAAKLSRPQQPIAQRRPRQ